MSGRLRIAPITRVSAPRVGSMFSGYGGMEMGLGQVIDCEPAWFADNDLAATKVLAHHWPDVANLGDVTSIDWGRVEPVDVITAGFPCQPISSAGRQLGDDDERWLWDEVARAVGALRPGLVLLENVRHLLAIRRGRLFGRILGDLAELGYDAWWYGLRAADVGAAHGRFRVFVFASPADAASGGRDWGPLAAGRRARWRALAARGGEDVGAGLSLFRTPTAQLAINGGSQHPDRRRAGGHGPTLADEVEHLLPTPRASEGMSGTLRRNASDPSRLEDALAMHLLPTPRATDGTKGGPNQRGSSGDLMLPGAVHLLLPTPTAMDCKASGGRAGGSDVALTDATVRETRPWAQYEAAVRRHERALGRPAPEPTEPGKNGPRLSPRFVEWLQMLPKGHVTDPRIGLSRNEQLRLLGNGVVGPQCAAAFRQYLADAAAEVAS